MIQLTRYLCDQGCVKKADHRCRCGMFLCDNCHFDHLVKVHPEEKQPVQSNSPEEPK